MARHIDLEKSKFHLLAVCIAADLADVKEQGEAISLEAMNAKVLFARAGNMALGFRPITDFMVQLADNTIRLVREIEREALAVSHQAVERLRTLNAVRMARKAIELGDAHKARFRGDLEPFLRCTVNHDEETVKELLGHARMLTKLLDEIAEQMIAASAISSSARIEAAAIDTRYSQSFQSVSEKLEQCSVAVLGKVKSNLNLLNHALDLQRN
ncbi:MAG: hypothetical protein AB3N28_04430 [Kordiimonas sp.]